MDMEDRKIYILCHEYILHEGDPDFEETVTKELFYSFHREKCEAEISYYRDLPGFKEFPDGFVVRHNVIEERYWETGFERN
jgi:hypothetical protein